MKQELRETVQEMQKADEKDIQDILNRRPTGHYWIVITHKPTKMRLDTGEQVLMRLVKAYDKKPPKLLGTVVLEVKDGEVIDQDVNPHDAPIDWGGIEKHAGLIETPSWKQDPISAPAYVYTRKGKS